MFKFFEILIEIISWMKIVLSPTLIGAFIGFIVFYNMPNFEGRMIGFSLAGIGLLIGIIWACKIWKTTGTTHFIARVDASPDFDGKMDRKEAKKP